MKRIVSVFFLLAFGVFASSGTIPSVYTSSPSEQNIPSPTKSSIKGLKILGENYAIDNHSAYVVNETRSAWIKIPADHATFTVLSGQFARDRDQVFQMGKKIEGADLANFSVISGQHGYAQDNVHIYGPHGILDADPATFRMMTGQYSADAGHVFFEGKTIDADSGLFRVIDNGLYAVDGEKVFYAGRVLQNTPVEDFRVTGSRAFAANGTTFFEGQREKGDMPMEENSGENSGEDPSHPVSVSEPSFDSTIASVRELVTAYKPFWSMIFFGLLGFFGLFFIFFADRNDERASLWKTLITTLLAAIAGGLALWISSLFWSLSTSVIIGFIVAFFFFVVSWRTFGWFKSLLITLLTFIGMIFYLALAALATRVVFGSTQEFADFVNHSGVRLLGMMKIIGFFVGAWLIAGQLGAGLLRSLGQALVSTFVSVLLIGLIMWVINIGVITSIIIFGIFYAIVLWILRFRNANNLFAESVRIVRVALILVILIALIGWLVL